ncbi:Hypothetical protein FKW44_008087 [Caligus rogercresseyi]|uniref:Uncharacterized protein n=1 Tax=Caligus rogercresseyi TaxID=217165 RepID=A0A7T8KFT3_CALRO|nr:Hypothetical protein FKW44_008087 [Caligus rogercresseyi]
MLTAEVQPIELGLLRSQVPFLVLESEEQRASLKGEFGSLTASQAAIPDCRTKILFIVGIPTLSRRSAVLIISDLWTPWRKERDR